MPEIQYRNEQSIRAKSEDAGGNTFALSFSSETPYRRYDFLTGEPYDEILSHADGAVDLTRLSEIGCLLYGHDRDRIVGRVDRVAIENGRGVADVTFDEDEDSQKIAAKVRSGSLRAVSVGYHVCASHKKKRETDGEIDQIIVDRWEPVEISLVSVPADPTVGVGRSETDPTLQNRMEENKPMENEPIKSPTPEVSADEQIRAALSAERDRVSALTELGTRTGMDVSELIKNGATVAEANERAVNHLIASRAPVSVSVTVDEFDKFRDAAADALLLRAGAQIERPAEGANALRGLSFSRLASETLRRSGVDTRYLSDDALFDRAFFDVGSAFAALMDTTLERAFAREIKLANGTYERWTNKGSLRDFKVAPAKLTRGDVGELLKVTEGGEIEHDTPTIGSGATRKLDTYARQFSITREAFVNDDVSFFSDIPARYARAAKATINHQVYKALVDNGNTYDGHALFSSDHGNLVTVGTAPTMASLSDMLVKMATQTNAHNQGLLIRPKYILCSPELEPYFQMLIGANNIKTTAIASSATEVEAFNPLRDRGLEIVADPDLAAQLTAASSPYAWFLVGDRGDVDNIEVDFLNGSEEIKLRRMEAPGRLGFIYDIYLDWGISVLDWHGLRKNPGTSPTPL